MTPVHYEDFVPSELHTAEMDAPRGSIPQHHPPTPGTGVAASTSNPEDPIIHASPLTTLKSTDHEFTTLVRLLEDYAHKRYPYRKPFAPFVPRFDLEEHEHTYELYGDFPGVKKEEISVSVVDNGRIEIRGVIRHRVSEEEYRREQADHTHDVQVGGIKQDLEVKLGEAVAAATGGTQQPDNHTGSHIADTHEPPTTSPDAAKHANEPQSSETSHPDGAKIKTIIKERQEGTFHRIFHFAQPVNLDKGVQARMDNGVLHVTIPRGAVLEKKEVDIGWFPYFGL